MIRAHWNGQLRELEALPGETLADLLRRAGLPINAPCGGRGTCGKCAVRVRYDAATPEPLAHEREHLSPENLERGLRLACAAPALPCEVWLEDGGEAAIMTGGAKAALDAPSARRVTVRPAPPTLEDPLDDLSRLEEALGYPVAPTPYALTALPAALRSGTDVCVTLFDGENGAILLDAGREGDPLGVAVDIGTTTLAAYLINLATGEELGVRSRLNPQAAFGADVIARCGAAADAEGLAALAKAVRGAVAEMILEFGVSVRDIAHVVFAGNTVMMHLLAGVSPAAVAVIPFAPAFTRALTLPAEALNLPLPCALATLLPGVAGYVGADTVAAALASFEDGNGAPALLIDIGTNGEMALGFGGRVLCCATAAGPAFEGAHIRHGMGGVAGAISRVAWEDGALRMETIGNATPRGICGSGLLDATAVLLKTGVLDETGAMDPDEAPDGLTMTQEDGKPALLLAHGENGPVTLTARDIREVQLAKAAIAAGVKILLDKAGIAAGEVGCVMLAGGFGTFMDVASACAIGLIPPELEHVARGVGNAAGSGARAALLSRTALKKAEVLARSMEYVELSSLPEFQDKYVDEMMF